MTVSSDLNKHIYVGNDSTILFSFTFYVLSEDDLHLYLTDTTTGTTTEITSNYTVSPTGGSFPANSGSVTYPVSGDPLTSTQKLILLRTMDLLQPTVYPNNTALKPKVVEKSFDRITMQAQQLNEVIDRAMQYAITTDDTISRTFPAPVANATIMWNDDGTELISGTDTSVFPVSDIQSAIDHVTDTTNAHASSAISYTSSGTGAVVRTVNDKLSEYVSVKDFGAVGDGVTDDTDAIQAAINYVQSNGGILISNASAIYKITSALSITSSYVKIDFNGAKLVGYGAINVLELAASGSVYYGYLKNIIITAGDTSVLRGIYGHTPWWHYENVIVTGIESSTRYFTIAGVELIQSWCASFYNVRVNDIIGKGIYFNGAPNNIDLNRVTVRRTTGNSIDIYQGSGIKMTSINVETIDATASAIVINLCYAVTLDNVYFEGVTTGITLTGGTVGCCINNIYVYANNISSHKSINFVQCAGIEVNGFFSYGESDSTALYMASGADVNRVWVNNVIYSSWSGTTISSYLTSVYCDYHDGSSAIKHKFNHSFNGTTICNGSVTTDNNQLILTKNTRIKNTLIGGATFVSIAASGTHNITVNLNDLYTFAIRIKYVFFPTGTPTNTSYIEKLVTGYAYSDTSLVGVTITSVLSVGTSASVVTIGTPTFTTGRLLTIPVTSTGAVNGHMSVEVLENSPTNLTV